MELFTIYFERPFWLLSIIPVLLLAYRYYQSTSSNNNWKALCDSELIEHVVDSAEGQTSKWPVILLCIAAALLSIALSGPSWNKKDMPAIKNESALVIALDLSRSMNAQDIKPSRLQRAKFKIEDLINQRKDGQTALIVYAGEAFSVSPLTHDINTIISQLPVFNPEIMPVQGNNTKHALQLATQLLKQAERTTGDILLVTDDVNKETNVEPFKEAVDNGFNVSILGVGTTQGAPIPYQGSMIKNKNNQPVIVNLDIKAMESAAAAGQGIFVALSNNDSDVTALANQFNRQEQSGNELADTLKIDSNEQEGALFVLLALPFLLVLFRRSAANALAAIVVLPFMMPVPSHAATLDELWKTKDQQAAQLLSEGHIEQAAQTFENKRWKQIAAYQSKNYEQALMKDLDMSTSQDWYNQGNTLAQLKRIDEAINAYEQAIVLDAKNEDALFNKELLEKLKQEQEKKNEDKNKDKQQSKDDQQGDENKDKQQSQDGQQGDDNKDKQPSKDGQQGDDSKDKQQSQDGQQGDDSKDKQQSQDGQQGDENKDKQQSQDGQQGDENKDKQQSQDGQQGDDSKDKQQSQDGQQGDDSKDKQQSQDGQQGDENKDEQQSQGGQQGDESKDKQQSQDGQQGDSKGDENKAASDQSLQSNEEDTDDAVTSAKETTPDEDKEAKKAWLRRVKDDPALLWKRKFMYQYRKNNQQAVRNGGQQW